MASGGAGAGPPIDPAAYLLPSREDMIARAKALDRNLDQSTYIYEIDPKNIKDNIYIGSTYKYNNELVICVLSDDGKGKYLKTKTGKSILLPLDNPLYTNKPPAPPSREAELADLRALNRNISLKKDLRSYKYEVNPTLISTGKLIQGQYYKYNEQLVYWVLVEGTGMLKDEMGNIIEDPYQHTLYANILPDVDALIRLLHHKDELTKEQKTLAIDFITYAEDLSYINSDGETLLMIAIKNSHWPIAAALIARGVDLNIESNEKKTAANYFCENENEEFKGRKTVRQLLIMNGARVGSAAAAADAAAAAAGEPAAEESSCILQGGRRSQRTKNARKQTRRQRAKKNRKSRRTTQK